jgi:hypothetical protein
MTWLLGGNSNVTTTSFLGTTTPLPLVIKTNNKEAMRVASADGDVSIGELGASRSPDYKLDVQGILNADDIYKDGTQLVGSQWEDVTDDGISYGAGNVGIGKAPAANYRLDVAGTLNATRLHKNGSPLISSQWQNVSSGISYTAGNVGVGKAPGDYQLDVAGIMNALEYYRDGSLMTSSQWRGGDTELYYAGVVSIGTEVTGAGITVDRTSERSDEWAVGIDANAFGGGTGTKTGIWASAQGGGLTVGGRFEATSNSPRARPIGQVCSASGEGTGPKYGIYADASGAGTLYAGWFQNNVLVEGNLETPGGKSFLIDHPLDPENKTLRHNSVESPENLCLYRGKVKLGPNGRDTVRMPNYFAALIKEDEATAYLTPVGKEPFPTSYKWNEAHTELTIFGTAGAEVAYLVLADRDDRTIHLFSRPVEEEKGGSNFERGKLLSPEAFDQPLERGVAPLPTQEEQTIRAEPIPPRAVPPEPIAPEMPAEDKGEGSH